MKITDFFMWLWIACLLLIIGVAPFVTLALLIKFLFF